ncbi:MAG: hypothetical protein ACPKPY_09935 [Nitrososphaeraceae archaeon]
MDELNTVLIEDELEKQYDTILELFNPIYSAYKKILKYETTATNTTSVYILSLDNQLYA